ncbi:MAG: ABC transporter permease subunit [Marinilabiliales bacterium]|nr:ABC transporter permease subunit [Marinilabiliales bacterium]
MVLKQPWLQLKGIYRVLLIIPWAVPNYITALIWKGMFHQQYGAVNHVLGAFGITPISWFSSFFTSFSANVVTNTWLGFPFMMVIALGALQSIPSDIYEAADVDGAAAGSSSPSSRCRSSNLHFSPRSRLVASGQVLKKVVGVFCVNLSNT